MPQTQDRLVLKWIVFFGSIAVLLVIFGGFVRLTRSGLSIVEWKPVSGTIPPLHQRAWEEEFSKYRATPEYQQVNRGMTLQAYKQIFWIEWLHRLLARVAGLAFAIPFLTFLIAKRIPIREAALYVVMGFLFLVQALMGWLMVSSGLADRPAVSHYLLAAHLLLALSLVGLAAWTALGHSYGFKPPTARAPWSTPSRVALVGLAALLLQIAYGAFSAGLRAGLVSNTWPLMLGRWIPVGLLAQAPTPVRSLLEAPLTVVFVHRWLAIGLLIIAVLIERLLGRARFPAEIRRAVLLTLFLGAAQISLGILVVTSGVSIALALLHQFGAICLFLTTLFLLHRSRSRDLALAVSKP